MSQSRPPLEEMTLRQLRRVASEYEVSRYSRMRKSELVEAIQAIEAAHSAPAASVAVDAPSPTAPTPTPSPAPVSVATAPEATPTPAPPVEAQRGGRPGPGALGRLHHPRQTRPHPSRRDGVTPGINQRAKTTLAA